MQTFYLVIVAGAKDPDWKVVDERETPVGIRSCWTNKNSGYCLFCEDDEIIAEVEAYDWDDLDWNHLIEGFDDDWSIGWLDRSGRFTPCRSWLHDQVADLIFGLEGNTLETRGWVKLWGIKSDPQFSNEKNLSAEQRNWMSRRGFNLEGYD